MFTALAYLAAGLIGGVLGGMGMGGGTLLIPILVLFYGVDQHIAQGCNLIGFIPMAAAALVIHFKNRLVDLRGYFYIALPAVAFAVLGSLLSKAVESDLLTRCFGGFLIALAFVQVFMIFIKPSHR